MAGSNARNREEVVFTIVSLLVTEKPSYNIPIPKLESLYRSTESERIPYKLLGYPSIVEFLRTIPQIQLVVRDGTHFINFLGSEKTRELTDLVVKQKTSQKCQRSRSTARTKGPRGVPSGYFSRSQSALSPRMSDNFLRLCSETLEILEKSPIKLTKTILMYKVREKKPGYFDMQTLNDVLHSLGGKVIIDDQMVSAASKVGRQHEISWDSNQQEPPPPKNPVIVRNAQVEEEDESGIDDYGDYDNNQVTVKNDKLVAAISAGQEAPQITQRDARGNEENLGVNDPRTQAEVEMIINERMRFRLEKLIQNCPGGIWCSELAKMYYEKYNLNLEWQQLGFNSLSDLVLHLPDIFYCVQPSPTADFRVFDAKNRDKGEAVMPVKLTLSAIHRIYPDPEDEVRAIPARLSPETGNRLIPEDAVPLGESVGQVLIDSFNQEDKGYEEIVVCDAFTPSFFWIHLRRKIYKHTSMMDEMQVFYDQKASSYGVPLILLEKGLNVVCKFYGKWHRGIVKNIEPDAESTTAILFYDYGTLHKYPANEIYFLHRIFSNLPAQAIPCGLYNIKPPEDYEALRNPDGKVRWSIDTSRRFVQRVHDRPLVAICGKKFYENNSMLLSLTDTSSDEDVNIGEWLVNDGLAVYGSMVRIRPKNFPYKQSLTCKAPQPYKKSRKAIKKLISIVKTSPPSDVSKLSNTRGSISKVESLRTKFFEKKPAKSAATCPTCGHAIVNLPDPKIEQVPDIPRVNGVVSPVEAEVMPQVGKLYDEVPRLHGTAMQMIGHWVETGYMPGIAIPPARESSDEWMERGLTADDIPVQSNRSADQIEIPLKFDEKTQTPEEIFVEAPYTPENETVVSIEVGMKPLHLLPPVTIDVDDTVSEFETVMKPQRQVLQSGIIDWETFTIIDTNSEPKPVEKGELFKIIPKPKRKIVATDELLDDASWGGGAAEWEEELGEIKQEMILPIINQALRNNKKELKYSRVVVRRDIPGERHTSNGLGQSSETSGVPITELKKTEEKRSGGEEPSELSPSVAVNNSVANKEYAELDGVLQSLDVQPSSLNAVNGGLPGEETRINEEAGANGDLEDNEKTIEFSPLLETTPGITEGLSPTILIEEIPSAERELDDTIIQDNLEEVNYSLDTETPRQQRVLIEELSFSEDSEGVDMVSVYAEMLKKSPRFLKQILEPHSTEECSELDSDDESREIFNDKESIDKSIEKIEIIDQDDVPGTVEPTEKNNNEIIPTESIDNSLTSKLKSKYSDGESLEDNSRLELINNEKNQLTNGISEDYTYIPIYDSSDFSSDDEEFDVYLAGEDKFYGLSPDIGRLREITINGTYVKDISNEENCKLLSLKSSDEIKRDEDDDDVEEVYRSPEETDDSFGVKVDPDDLKQYTEDYDWDRTEDALQKSQATAGNSENNPIIQNLVVNGVIASTRLAERGAQMMGLIDIIKIMNSKGMDMSMIDVESIFLLEKVIHEDWEKYCPEKPHSSWSFLTQTIQNENDETTVPVNGIDQSLNGTRDVACATLELEEELGGFQESLSTSQNAKEIDESQGAQIFTDIHRYVNVQEVPVGLESLDENDMEDLGTFDSGSSIRILDECDESMYSAYDLADTNPFKIDLISRATSPFSEHVEQKVLPPPIPPRTKKQCSMSTLSRVDDEAVSEGNSTVSQSFSRSDIEMWTNHNYLFVQQNGNWTSSEVCQPPEPSRGISVPPGFKPVAPLKSPQKELPKNENEIPEFNSANTIFNVLSTTQENRSFRQPDCLQVELLRGPVFIFFMNGSGWITIDQFRRAFTNFADNLAITNILLERRDETCLRVIRREENPRMFNIIERKVVGSDNYAQARYDAFYLVGVNIVMCKMLRAFGLVSQEDLRQYTSNCGVSHHPVLHDFAQIFRACKEAIRQMNN